MEQALIIGRDGPEADSAVQGLWDADYRSIMRVSDPVQALSVLYAFHPQLIMVLPEATSPESIRVLEEISEAAGAPIIVATSNVAHALDCLGPRISLDGPFAMDEVRHAHAAATEPALLRRAA